MSVRTVAALTGATVATLIAAYASAQPKATPTPHPAPSAKDGRVYSAIKLPKSGFIHLELLDSYKERRSFLVTCEKELAPAITEAMLQTGVGYHPLKKGQKQSLINYWQTPPTDYVIECSGK